MIKKLDNYLGDLRKFYAGRAGLILGSSPSIKSVRDLNFPMVKLAVGDLPARDQKLGPYDFWVSSNGYYPLPQNSRHLRDISKSCKNFLLSPACVQLNASNMHGVLDELQKIVSDTNIILYDQRHFGNKECVPRNTCCDFYDHFELGNCIQDLLQLEMSSAKSYSVSHTVTTHAFAIAVLLKLNPIFIAGVNLPATWKKYKSYRPFKFPMGIETLKFNFYKLRNPQGQTPFAGSALVETLEDFQYIASVADKLGISVYSLNDDSPINRVNKIRKISVAEANFMMRNLGQDV